MEHRIYENEEIKNMFTAMGVSIGTEEDSKQLNIAKFILCEMQDAKESV